MTETTIAPGSVALITGGTGGFGRALAGLLREREVTVVLADLDTEANRQVAEGLGARFAGLEHRRVDRVAQGRADHPADAAEPGQGRLGLVRVDLDAVGVLDRGEELAHRRGERGGQPGRAEPGDG